MSAERRGEVWFGPVDLLNGRWRGSAPPVLAATVAAVEQAVPSNTILLPFGAEPVALRHVPAGPPQPEPVALAELYDGLVPGRALYDRVAPALGPGLERLPDSFVPLFYRGVALDGAAHVYGQLRFRGDEALFIRTSERPVPVGDDGALLDAACELHARDHVFMNNHQCYYRKWQAGMESEYKFTLGGEADIWTLTADLYEVVRRGDLPGYVFEYRDDFQTWDYLNHLFEVVAPEPERGYVSFIPTTDGRYTRKRKWYARDALTRREEHLPTVAIDEPLDDYVARTCPELEVRRLPSFRRVRYDVNYESVRTGHVYGTFFDHASLLDAPDVALVQCEVEYLRSRTVLEPDGGAVMPELAGLADWTEAFLRERGVAYRRDFTSKLTFLREAVAERPDLLGVAG